MSYVFIDNNRPHLVHANWLHYWNDGGKNWVSLRKVSPEEEDFYRRRALPEKHAALYGYPFEKKHVTQEEYDAVCDRLVEAEELVDALRYALVEAEERERATGVRRSMKPTRPFCWRRRNGPAANET